MDRNIALICDDAYVIPTMVTIQSIINNSLPFAGVIYHIYVCTTGLSKDNVQRLTNLSVNNVIVDVKVFLPDERLNEVIKKTHVSKTALIKFDLANHFSEIDTLLYLDSDIIVLQSIEELFRINTEDYYLAASFEYWAYYNNLRFCPSKAGKEDFYFNSGVMLLNLKKMRENCIPEKLWKNKLSNTKTTLMDQECFNNVCANRCKPLSVKWNFNPVFLTEEHLDGIKFVYHENYQAVDDLQQDIRVLHYVGKNDKPWVYKTGNLQELWQREYDSIGLNMPLNLQEYVVPKSTFVEKIKNKVKSYGVLGTVSYMWYLVKKRRK